MNRRRFVVQSSLAGSAVLLSGISRALAIGTTFPIVRPRPNKRNFTSTSVEKVIADVKNNIGNKELAWMFENCFPNTLDTTVDFSMDGNVPDTYVITGDIDAMWLRDSSAQVWPYVRLCKDDLQLKQLVAGVINRQSKCIIKDPYANAFYKNENKRSDWASDRTNMKHGIHERKWEIDSLCYPIRLAYGYWKETGDVSPFDAQWLSAMKLVLKTFKEQQRFDGKGPYFFQRRTEFATDSLPLGGYGYPVKPNGLICSMFRPSDDATIYPYLIPSNFFAVESLKQLGEMLEVTGHKAEANEANELRKQVSKALAENAIVKTEKHGEVYAYEVNGYGSYNLMDDVGSSRVDLQACKLEYSIVSPK